MHEFLEQCSDIILIGTNSQTCRIIKALNSDYGIRPILFAHRRPFSLNILLDYIFIKQWLPYNNYYTVHSILNISQAFPNNNIALVPCTSHFDNLIQSNAEIFENSYIVYPQNTMLNSLPSYKPKRGHVI